ncbi:cytochrome b/b6 domain-containing protein [Plastoroseomonas hellenica]|uniref:cytochrome b/b6 domain-containing protein n=1 Tax=Plastoroseomonas hellenica TaxID=2687306 RepID=UPI001BA471B3|nr:cytochrome b/b6 domain-containing protein [Plastoroseomonas hellenica]MBR0645864.1 hydrogenase [Plastoroseomonas hellenica]
MAEAWRRVKVWDGWVRLFHWSLVALVAASWGTAQTGNWRLHFLSGYSILALLGFRILWGFLGSDTARFGRFLRSPLVVARYLGGIFKRGPDAEPGHNPAGGWMVALMLALLLAQVGTGLFADPDDYVVRGPFAARIDSATSYAVAGWHFRLFNVILAVVALHVLAILAYRLIKRHDLLGPMLTGRKRMPPEAPAPRIASPLLGGLLFALAAGAAYALSRFGAAP